MKCPVCGGEMTIDSHRKIDMYMCYSCGYIEGRNTGVAPADINVTNYERLRTMNLNEAVAFISAGLGIPSEDVADWLDDLSDT